MHCKLRVLMAQHDPPLTQTALIERTKLGNNTVGRLVNNSFSRLDVATVNTLLNFFDCDISDLFEVRERDDA